MLRLWQCRLVHAFVHGKIRARWAATGGIAAIVAAVAAMPVAAQAPTLDRLFRDMLRAENDGELPSYLRDQGANDPRVSAPAAGAEAMTATPGSDGDSADGPGAPDPLTPNSPPNATDPLLQPGEPPLAGPAMPGRRWTEVIEAIQGGTATPFDVAEVQSRADRDDPEGVELLAWMFATGTAVPRDLPAAYALYRRAALLEVPQAATNAEEVFRVMTPAERRRALQPTG